MHYVGISIYSVYSVLCQCYTHAHMHPQTIEDSKLTGLEVDIAAERTQTTGELSSPVRQMAILRAVIQNLHNVLLQVLQRTAQHVVVHQGHLQVSPGLDYGQVKVVHEDEVGGGEAKLAQEVGDLRAQGEVGARDVHQREEEGRAHRGGGGLGDGENSRGMKLVSSSQLCVHPHSRFSHSLRPSSSSSQTRITSLTVSGLPRLQAKPGLHLLVLGLLCLCAKLGLHTAGSLTVSGLLCLHAKLGLHLLQY